MLKSIQEHSPSGLMDDDERVAIAVIFVRHAVDRTPVGQVNWASARSRVLYCYRHNWIHRLALHLALFGLFVITPMEKSHSLGRGPPAEYWEIMGSVEVMCAFVFLVDLCMQLVCVTPKVFIRDAKSMLYALCVLSIVLDSCVAMTIAGTSMAASKVEERAEPWYPFRWSRILRPVLLPYISKTCAHMATSIAHTLPSLADLTMCMLATVLFYALLGASLFGQENPPPPPPISPPWSVPMPSAPPMSPGSGPPPPPPLEPYTNMPYLSSHIFEEVTQPLSTLHTTMLHLTILIFTADNYPGIMWESFACEGVGMFPRPPLQMRGAFPVEAWRLSWLSGTPPPLRRLPCRCRWHRLHLFHGLRQRHPHVRLHRCRLRRVRALAQHHIRARPRRFSTICYIAASPLIAKTIMASSAQLTLASAAAQVQAAARFCDPQGEG